MNSKSTAALLLAGLLVAGIATVSAGQAASAHTFSGDESADFLAKVDAIKIHMTLVGRNLGDEEAALHHVEHAMMQFDEGDLDEIGEKNARLATDIPASFEELSVMIEGGESKPAIAQQIRGISDLLAEAIDVRIEPDQLTNSTMQATRVSVLINHALSSYEAAHGAASDHEHDATEDNEGSGHASDGIVDKDSYIAAKLFTYKAKSTFYRISADAPDGQASMAAREGLVDLRDAVKSHSSLEDVTVTVHTRVHQNIMDAFGLELAAAEEEGHEHADEVEHEEEGEHEEDHTG
jgi:hypothetical protein